jgi:hypothetical protein
MRGGGRRYGRFDWLYKQGLILVDARFGTCQHTRSGGVYEARDAPIRDDTWLGPPP